MTELIEDGYAIVKEGPCKQCGHNTVRAYPTWGGLIKVCSLECLEKHEREVVDDLCGEDETLVFLKKQAD